MKFQFSHSIVLRSIFFRFFFRFARFFAHAITSKPLNLRNLKFGMTIGFWLRLCLLKFDGDQSQGLGGWSPNL